MKVAIGCDHGGYILKQACIDAVLSLGHEVIDFGTDNCDVSVDYPDFALKVAKAVVSGEADKGILLCGTGIGISIAANKVRGIRCAHITDMFSAQMVAEHNNANIIAMGGRITTPLLAKEMTIKFLTTAFAGGRHQTRINKITDIENNNL
ncbi:ribose 5-phosphate isomerase B [bacterium]|nr:ribose 5-phosphate isomerase B [bacterium]